MAGACGAPLAVYLSTGAELEDPIYSGWKVLFVTATVAVSLIGLLGGAIAIHEQGWGAALLCVSAVMVFLLVFLIAIRDQPPIGSALNATPPALPVAAACLLAAVRHHSGGSPEEERS